MSNTTATKRTQVLALWKKTSKDGKKSYFTGACNEKECYLTAFYNTDKKNLKEPDLKVYARDDEGNLSKDPILSLWCNASKGGKKYLSGKMDGKRVVGFINSSKNEKAPYISVYWSDEDEEKTEAPKKEEKPKFKKKEEPKFEEIKDEDNDLPF